MIKCPLEMDCCSWTVISKGALVCWCRNQHEQIHQLRWKVLWKEYQDCKILVSKLPKVLFTIVLSYIFTNGLFIHCIQNGDCSDEMEDCYCNTKFSTDKLYCNIQFKCFNNASPWQSMLYCDANICSEEGFVAPLFVIYRSFLRPLMYSSVQDIPHLSAFSSTVCLYKFDLSALCFLKFAEYSRQEFIEMCGKNK